MTTQDADTLITGANQSSNNASFDVRLALKFLKEHVSIFTVHYHYHISYESPNLLSEYL